MKLLYKLKLAVFLLPVLSLSLASGVAHAAGTATFTLAQSGNSVSIYEDSASQSVNTVEADLTYGDSQGTIRSMSVSTAGSPFTTCTSSTTSSIVCSLLG